MVRGKSSTEVREMFNISYDPPGEGLNAIEDQTSTTQEDNAVVPPVQSDSMKQ